MKTSFENSFVHCIDKLDIIKKLFFLLLLVPMVFFCQSTYISYYENGKIKVAGESFEEIVGSKVSVKKI